MYTWINHHIEAGHGPPTFFITLSCAEYMWPDIKRLMIERFTIAGLDVSVLDKSFVQVVNDYTLIVQEYFHEKIRLWLSTIGAKVFHIKYFWLRYEFAPSRGQIHAHMLAIHDNPSVLKPYYLYKNNKKQQEEFLYQRISQELGITAILPKISSMNNKHTQMHPSKILYSNTLHKKEKDFVDCLQKLQYHKCSKFCMQKRHIL